MSSKIYNGQIHIFTENGATSSGVISLRPGFTETLSIGGTIDIISLSGNPAAILLDGSPIITTSNAYGTMSLQNANNVDITGGLIASTTFVGDYISASTYSGEISVSTLDNIIINSGNINVSTITANEIVLLNANNEIIMIPSQIELSDNFGHMAILATTELSINTINVSSAYITSFVATSGTIIGVKIDSGHVNGCVMDNDFANNLSVTSGTFSNIDISTGIFDNIYISTTILDSSSITNTSYTGGLIESSTWSGGLMEGVYINVGDIFNVVMEDSNINYVNVTSSTFNNIVVNTGVFNNVTINSGNINVSTISADTIDVNNFNMYTSVATRITTASEMNNYFLSSATSLGFLMSNTTGNKYIQMMTGSGHPYIELNDLSGVTESTTIISTTGFNSVSGNGLPYIYDINITPQDIFMNYPATSTVMNLSSGELTIANNNYTNLMIPNEIQITDNSGNIAILATTQLNMVVQSGYGGYEEQSIFNPGQITLNDVTNSISNIYSTTSLVSNNNFSIIASDNINISGYNNTTISATSGNVGLSTNYGIIELSAGVEGVVFTVDQTGTTNINDISVNTGIISNVFIDYALISNTTMTQTILNNITVNTGRLNDCNLFNISSVCTTLLNAQDLKFISASATTTDLNSAGLTMTEIYSGDQLYTQLNGGSITCYDNSLGSGFILTPYEMNFNSLLVTTNLLAYGSYIPATTPSPGLGAFNILTGSSIQIGTGTITGNLVASATALTATHNSLSIINVITSTSLVTTCAMSTVNGFLYQVTSSGTVFCDIAINTLGVFAPSSTSTTVLNSSGITLTGSSFSNPTTMAITASSITVSENVGSEQYQTTLSGGSVNVVDVTGNYNTIIGTTSIEFGSAYQLKNVYVSSPIITVNTSGYINYPVQPAFFYYLTNNVSIGSGTGGIVKMDTLLYDRTNSYSMSTGFYTIPSTGLWNINTTADVSGGQFIYIAIGTNYSTFKKYITYEVSGAAGIGSGSMILPLTQGQSISYNAGVSSTIYGTNGTGGPIATQFSGYMIF